MAEGTDEGEVIREARTGGRLTGELRERLSSVACEGCGPSAILVESPQDDRSALVLCF